MTRLISENNTGYNCIFQSCGDDLIIRTDTYSCKAFCREAACCQTMIATKQGNVIDLPDNIPDFILAYLNKLIARDWELETLRQAVVERSRSVPSIESLRVIHRIKSDCYSLVMLKTTLIIDSLSIYAI